MATLHREKTLLKQKGDVVKTVYRPNEAIVGPFFQAVDLTAGAVAVASSATVVAAAGAVAADTKLEHGVQPLVTAVVGPKSAHHIHILQIQANQSVNTVKQNSWKKTQDDRTNACVHYLANMAETVAESLQPRLIFSCDRYRLHCDLQLFRWEESIDIPTRIHSCPDLLPTT